ncbi:MAG: helix-turn-helix transcriptional regulator, partial [Rhizomicrobium sp.]
IAKMCGFSLRYIHDLFRDEGCTLRDYLMHERLQCARTMLEAGDKTVTDVCMAAGFTSLSHFSTAFRREFSIPPSKVRRGDARDARR